MAKKKITLTDKASADRALRGEMAEAAARAVGVRPSNPLGSTVPVSKVARQLVPVGGNDNIQTPQWLADQAVAALNPKGVVMDPCRGTSKAFYKALKAHPGVKELGWAEKSEGVDFFNADGVWGRGHGNTKLKGPLHWKFDWLVTNTPWSNILVWWRRGMEVADNVAYLTLIPSVFQKAKRRAFRKAGFGIRHIVYLKTPPAKTPWPQTGSCLGMVHIQRGYTGPIQETFLDAEPGEVAT